MFFSARSANSAVSWFESLMPRRYYVLLTAITLVGAFLRLWQLATVPPGLHYDLAATALLGNEVAFNGYRPIFISAYTGHEALYYYWLARLRKSCGLLRKYRPNGAKAARAARLKAANPPRTRRPAPPGRRSSAAPSSTSQNTASGTGNSRAAR